ncbi:uncharacterized protein DNG_02125 [Cephalotrichum gorgonifer]|uniref:Methyltransferase domain-containing protein n=1 Tax=Cephalotrichum gorgonifer TaxID=2041049 RepID=A0AAE8SST6_9PEZI|nr:uncharacterized protein DNG_02125 [Cephalotrichum gorgonifer]
MLSAPNLTPTELFNKSAETYEAATGGGTRELVQHAISLIAGLKPLTSESKILDNVCGTGIVTDIILQSGIQPEIHAVDFAENMVNIARGRFSSYPNVHMAVMAGEKLSFPDDTFTYSITNLGLMFFTDADKGVREIACILHPDGVAVVTGWSMRAPFKIIQEIQAQVRPDDMSFKPPISDTWLDPEHIKAVLSCAGLDMHTSIVQDVYIGSEMADGLADILAQFSLKVLKSWSEEEEEKAAEVVKKIVQERAVLFTRPSGSGVGIKVTGTIFIVYRGSGRVLAL